MKHIHIKSIPHSAQEYDTMGNWFETGDAWEIEVDEMDDWRKETLVAIHELIEMALCIHRGIAEADVTAFDKAHLDVDQPGDLEDAPYRKEHKFADKIEKLVAEELGVEWESY